MAVAAACFRASLPVSRTRPANGPPGARRLPPGRQLSAAVVQALRRVSGRLWVADIATNSVIKLKTTVHQIEGISTHENRR